MDPAPLVVDLRAPTNNHYELLAPSGLTKFAHQSFAFLKFGSLISDRQYHYAHGGGFLLKFAKPLTKPYP